MIRVYIIEEKFSITYMYRFNLTADMICETKDHLTNMVVEYLVPSHSISNNKFIPIN